MTGWATAVRAELVVLTDGRVVKAASHRIAGDEIEISVPGGGSYTVDRARVEQIVQDEVLASEAPAPRPTEPPPAIRRPEVAAPPARPREETYLAPEPLPPRRKEKEQHRQQDSSKRPFGRRSR